MGVIMSNTFVAQLDGADFMFSKNENMKEGLFKQYERVIVRSIITSFGLDFLVSDRNGGDVRTQYPQQSQRFQERKKPAELPE